MNREAATNKICVALDVPSRVAAENLIEQLRNEVGMFKVGMELFTAEGPTLVRDLTAAGLAIFLDLKFHDIPNTVAGASKAAARLGVAIFNVHAAGGLDMMRAAFRSASEFAEASGVTRPKIIAVTVLTSIDDAVFESTTGSQKTVSAQVVDLARMAQDASLDGVVASPQEIESIRSACGPQFLIVTPGVRGTSDNVGDQRRIMTPINAVRAGADILVIGRPIHGASNPCSAARSITQELQTA
jgi:orotidine-5'-phosphate decarboxylase